MTVQIRKPKFDTIKTRSWTAYTRSRRGDQRGMRITREHVRGRDHPNYISRSISYNPINWSTRGKGEKTFKLDEYLSAENYPRKFEGITVVEGHGFTIEGNTITSESLMPGLHEYAQNRFRSVCNTGIISISIFGGCIGYLLTIDYIQFEVGIPALLGLTAILIGFLNGLRGSK